MMATNTKTIRHIIVNEDFNLYGCGKQGDVTGQDGR
jgi:hypothetical protein